MKRILCFALSLLFLLVCAVPAFAASGSQPSLKSPDHTSVEEDLNSALPGWEQTYTVNSAASMCLITFFEFGYKSSYSSVLQRGNTDFALYLYVYNPSGEVRKAQAMDNVQLAVAYDDQDKATSYRKYSISPVSMSAGGTVVKYKIIIADPSSVVHLTNDGERLYDISSFELYDHGHSNAEDYRISTRFIVSGYLQGMGNGNNTSTLSIRSESLTVADIEVHQTSYLTGNRPQDDAGYSVQLNSCFFALDNDLFEDYGNPYSVLFEYYKYRTAPMIVTTDDEVYNRLYGLRGHVISDQSDFSLYSYDSLVLLNSSGFFNRYYHIRSFAGRIWNIDPKFGMSYLCLGDSVMIDLSDDYRFLNILPIVFKVDDIQRGQILVSADDLNDYFKNYSYGTRDVRGRYSRNLFDLSYPGSGQYVLEEVTMDDAPITVPSYYESQNWWDQFWLNFRSDRLDRGLYNVEPYKVLSLSDVNGKTDQQISEDLYISLDDVEELRTLISWSSFNNHTVCLLRYACTDDYHSEYMGYTTDRPVPFMGMSAFCPFVGDDILLAEETVYLDFDIIQFGFRDSFGVVTVIPVVSNPTNGFTGIEDTTSPPVDVAAGLFRLMDGFKDGWNKIFSMIMIVAVVIAVILVIKILLKLFGGRQKVRIEMPQEKDKPRGKSHERKK